MIKEADKSGDGSITFEEFFKVMKKKCNDPMNEFDSDDDLDSSSPSPPIIAYGIQICVTVIADGCIGMDVFCWRAKALGVIAGWKNPVVISVTFRDRNGVVMSGAIVNVIVKHICIR